jgi:hypothetical protein
LRLHRSPIKIREWEGAIHVHNHAKTSADCRGILLAAESVPGFSDVMYTTWQISYGDSEKVCEEIEVKPEENFFPWPSLDINPHFAIN